MKKITSIKTRITIWYAVVIMIIIFVILSLIGVLSYSLSIDGIEKDVVLQVTQISDRLSARSEDVFSGVENDEEFKNVSIYDKDGKYIVGKYDYNVSNIEFRIGKPRREKIDGNEYIVYDVLKHTGPNTHGGLWIRGIESLNSTYLLGRTIVKILIVVIPLMLILAVFGGYYVTKKAFSPISNIINTSNEITKQRDLSKRIEINPLSKEDELKYLSLTLNNMLDKIEDLVNKEKQFTSDASHELRTPISVILAQGEYLAEMASTEKEKELAQNIVAKANQVSKLIKRLLLLSRIDQNRQKFNKEKIDIGLIADIAIESVSNMAKEKDITLSANVPDSIIVEADESLMLSVITNLVSNGIKYGKEHGYVNISAKKEAGKTKIVISDNGIGIAPEHMDKIWGRFYRVDDVRNDEYGSSGLGLSMVKSIIELHGGKITVCSAPGVGTEFTIEL